MPKTNPQKIKELLTRNVQEIIVEKAMFEKLKSGRALRIKHGVDPTTKDLHLGHAVVYWKLRDFQEMGHRVVFLIGDFTARFGDPTNQSARRKLKTKEEIMILAKSYFKQLGKILDMRKVELRHNGEWYDKWSWEDGLRLMSRFTTARMLERDMFQERVKKQKEIAYHEPVYPMLQAYDSVILKSDVTVIGTDQKFNELLARPEQVRAGLSPQDLVIVPLLLGIDGNHKMSQSLGNQISLSDSAEDMYGKIMSIPDKLIIPYFRLCTRMNQQAIAEIETSLEKDQGNPRDAKSRLAFEVAQLYHGEKAAQKAAKEFEKVFKKKELPSKLPQIKITQKKLPLLELLVKTKLAPSKAEAKRLVEQGGVRINHQTVKNWREEISIKDGMIVRVGRRKFIKLRTK